MSALPTNDHQFVVQNDEKTHVILPIEEYQRLLSAQSGAPSEEESDSMIAEAERSIADRRDGRWMDTAELAAALAWRRIDLARKARRMSQRELAEAAGLSQSRVSRIEREPKRASVDELQSIAKALDVELSALVSAIATASD